MPTRTLFCGLPAIAATVMAVNTVAVSAVAVGATPPAPAQARTVAPIPDRGAVPSIVEGAALEDEALSYRARAREYTRQIRSIRHRHLGAMRVPAVRLEGIDKLREFTDPAAYRPLIEELADEETDVRLALLDHFIDLGDDGQAALGWVAVTDGDPAIRNEAITRMVSPPGAPVLRVLDMALRSKKHEIANNAGALAGALGAIDAIPLLIFAQSTRDPRPNDEGDLAWIAIETQVPFVANLVPVVGDNSGAFIPVVGIINEGIVLRVMDAVVIVYRTEIHRALVSITTNDFGESTAHLGYDMKKWWSWYNSEFVPFKNEQARLAALAHDPEG